jgi:lysophospholipid acyltransferase (LPLAT)-like uncharacterized protein
MAAENPKPRTPDARRKPRKSGVVVPRQATWQQRLAAILIYILIRTVGVTVRFRLADPFSLLNKAPGEKLIFSFWHNRLALVAILRRRYVLRFAPERRMTGMVSASRDGGLLARVLEHFDIEPVRGSSSRRGGQALREMVSWAERGYDLAVTPDGPRGPCYTVQDGVISTAQLTGLPIVPVSYHLNWKIRARSWDRFQIPLPFARCEITVGKTMRVPREASDAEREELRKQLETELRAITRD